MEKYHLKIPEEKQYEYLTHHLEYLNEKIIESFVLFIKLATAIVGGVFFLSWKLLKTDPARSSFAQVSDSLFLLISISSILLILNNLFAWRSFRKTLTKEYPGITLSHCVRWWLSEAIMCIVIVATCVLFIFNNPLEQIERSAMSFNFSSFCSTYFNQIQIIIGAISLLISLIFMVSAVSIACRQLTKMRQTEDGKINNARMSLAIELEQNREWVKQFIDDSEKGVHLGRNGTYSWVWNPPVLTAYENYLTIACGENMELKTKIIELYSKLKSCEVILQRVYEVLSNNFDKKITEEKIIGFNEYIKNICESMYSKKHEPLEKRDLFDEPIRKLMQNDTNNTGNDDKQISEFLSSGTGSTGHLVKLIIDDGKKNNENR